MEQNMIFANYALAGTVVGGLITFFTQRATIKLANRTSFRAEETLKHYLSNKEWFDRDFETLKKKVGGFEDDELRKLLVCAGAVRATDRKEGTEWWTLLSRDKARKRHRAKRRSDGRTAN